MKKQSNGYSLNQQHAYMEQNKQDELWDFYAGEYKCPDVIDEMVTIGIEQLFTEHLELYSIYFRNDDFERYELFLDKNDLIDNKNNRERFVAHETKTGIDFGYDKDDNPIW